MTLLRYTNSHAIACVDATIYDIQAVQAACYRHVGRCIIDIRREGEQYIVTFTPKDGLLMSSVLPSLEEFTNDVLDEHLRLKLEQQAGSIRSLIVKHAFSPLENLSDEVPR